MKLCVKCNISKSIEDFPLNGIKNKNGQSGRRCYCRKCYFQIKKKHPSYEAQRKKKVINNKKFILEYLKNNPCVDCGISDTRVLEFDHVLPGKQASVSELLRKSLERIKKEISLCVVRCANCHRIKTFARSESYRHKEFEKNSI